MGVGVGGRQFAPGRLFAPNPRKLCKSPVHRRDGGVAAVSSTHWNSGPCALQAGWPGLASSWEVLSSISFRWGGVGCFQFVGIGVSRPGISSPPQKGKKSDLRMVNLVLPSLPASCANVCVGIQKKKKNQICYLVRANYPDNWFKSLSFVAGVDSLWARSRESLLRIGVTTPTPADLTAGDSCFHVRTWLRGNKP